MQAVFESIQRLASRIESAEQRTADTIAPIVEKVAELSEQLESAKDGGSTSTAPVERAVQKIAERLDQIESGSAPSDRALSVLHVRQNEEGFSVCFAGTSGSTSQRPDLKYLFQTFNTPRQSTTARVIPAANHCSRLPPAELGKRCRRALDA